jgi:NADPH:quinone reductase-like Zn-dependent oxidoreductase
MKAIVQDRYGPPEVLALREIGPPAIGDGDVLVRVRAAALHAGDWILMTGVPHVVRLVGLGLRRPAKRTPGFDVAGLVEAVGRKVTRFRPGDEVFGTCRGSCAEFAAGPENELAPRPGRLTFEQAAAVPMSGVTALHALRDVGKVRPGQEVLINGASGGVGTYAVQLGKALGADVTGVCSTRNLELVRAIGADRVIDYTAEDCTRGGRRYDLILDNAADHSLAEWRRALTPTGTFIPNNGTHGGRWFGGAARAIQALVLSPFVRQQLRPFVSTVTPADLVALTELIESGKVTPVIDRTYPLSEVVAAMRHVGTGHARGKVVVSI